MVSEFSGVADQTASSAQPIIQNVNIRRDVFRLPTGIDLEGLVPLGSLQKIAEAFPDHRLLGRLTSSKMSRAPSQGVLTGIYSTPNPF